MSSAATQPPAWTQRERSPPSARPTPADAAWLAVVPCALLLAAAVLLLGPPLADVLFPPSDIRFFKRQTFFPEETEQARFLIALTGPLLLSAAVVLVGRRPAPAGAAVAVRAVQWLVLAFLPLMIAAQYAMRPQLGAVPRVYFDVPTLVVAGLVAAAIAALLARPDAVARVREALRETPRRRLAAVAVAVAFLVVWMLTAFNTEGSIGRTHVAVSDNFPYWIDEVFAVLDGMYPLVTFHAQYGQVLPYALAAILALFGTTIGVYTATMTALTSAALLGVFATLRRVLRSSLLALALFLPLVAFGFFKEQGTFDDRYGPASLFSLFPIRYGGPFLLAWLLIRHLDGAWPRRRWLLFLVAGVVAIHNFEFGMAALGATLAALVWTTERPTARALGRLAGDVALGVAAAVAAVSLLTLVAAGSLPHFEQLSEYTRVYARGGYSMYPMPVLGFHLVIYVTFVAAVAVATVRALRGERDRLMTGLLCWIGVFGLGAGGYYAGRSHPEVLINVFSPWALAIVLLLVLAARAIAARPSRRPNPAELALMLCFGLIVCGLAQTPTPWTQIARLTDPTPTPILKPLAATRYIDSRTTPGERVAILVPLGHRIAYELGIDDAFPYAHLGSATAVQQWDPILAVLREPDVRKVYFPTVDILDDQLALITRLGYEPSDVDYDAQVVELQRGDQGAG